MRAVEVHRHRLSTLKKVKVIRKKILKSTRRKIVYKRNGITEITTKIMTPLEVTQMLNILGGKRELVQVPSHLTDDIEQLAEIVKGRGKEIVSGEVQDIGTHWNVREKESGTEKESESGIG